MALSERVAHPGERNYDGRRSDELVELYLQTLAPGSRRTMRQSLDAVAGSATLGATASTFRWTRLDYPDVVQIRSTLAARYAPATVNKCLAAVRGVLRQALLMDQVTQAQYAKCVAIRGVGGSATGAGRYVSAFEMNAIMKVGAEPTVLGLRDSAMVALLYHCGLRRSELVGLNLHDYDRGNETLNVAGKGHKLRAVYLNSMASMTLQRWLQVRGREPGRLFLRITQSGHVTRKELSSQAVYRLTARVARTTGVERPSPHDFRRTFVSALLDRGADLSVVQKLVGHASPTTTARYDRRGEPAMRRAVDLLVPVDVR